MYRILAVDDKPEFLSHVQDLLKNQGYWVDTLSNPFDVLQRITEKEYHCVLLDVKMPGIDGVSLLQHIKERKPYLPVVMVSGESTLRIAVDAIKLGAFDFIEKGADTDRLLITIQNAIAQCNWQKERNTLLRELEEQYQMVGESRAMRQIFQQIDTIAPTDTKVLITGETGTGKELVARAIHLRSKRSTKPYVRVNCAAIPETLIESTFFGHKKGSFTGALSDQTGKFEQADGGTIFLDEIGELPMLAQAKLLHVLQDGEIEKIGQPGVSRVDVRVICATNKDLQEMIAQGRFRDDLFHRINLFHIHLPPLRERVEDIPLLVEYYIQRFADEYNKTIVGISPVAMNALMQHPLPGNVRMLRNLIEKAVIFSEEKIISPEVLSLAMESSRHNDLLSAPKMNLNEFLESQEKQFLQRVLIICKGNRQKAAEMIGVDRATLWRKMKKYGLNGEE
ncbi:MAG: sigma-54-dependent Fis family transcriptional regulator [Methanobacteriota archaeon]|nr:MAG: sigma-54-dependent Fis family transcriptional regulator [Euryarchaeota archaeon]